MQLSNVVLPAPLGPMTPRISPLATVALTPLTAATPPKRFVTPFSSRRAAVSISDRRFAKRSFEVREAQPTAAAEEIDDPPRSEDHDEYQEEAEDDLRED